MNKPPCGCGQDPHAGWCGAAPLYARLAYARDNWHRSIGALAGESLADIERLRAALAVHKTLCPACETARTGDITADETPARALATSVSGAPFGAPTAALYPQKHPTTERPWGWYREITPGTFTVEKGDWPPPEPDDTAWYPLYSAPMTSRESPR